MSVRNPIHKKAARVRWYYLVIPLAVILLPVLLSRLAEPSYAVRKEGSAWVREDGDYAGAEACRGCHAGIVEQQLASNHARTVRDLSREAPLAPFDTVQAVADPLTGALYTMNRSKSGRPQLTLTLGQQQANQELAYEFGSGAHAHGYLARIDKGQWVDTRLNYYTGIQAWDFTSSQDKPRTFLTTQPLGRPQDEAQAAECFLCHSSVVRVQGKGTRPDGIHTRLRPDQSVLGVTCESCHGPKAEHVRERRSGRAAPAAPLSADEINRMCGKCHGLTNVNPAHPVLARFQPWGLDLSRCFRASAGRLSCLTCHDPHGNAEHSPAFFEAKCLSCHSGSSEVAKTVCPVNRKTGCVRCHMPVDSKSMLHMSLTDHRIRIVAGAAKRPARE